MGVFFNSKRGVLQPQQIWAKHPDDGWKPIKKAFMRVEAGSGKWRQFWPAVKKGLLDGSSLRWLLTGENTNRDGHPRDEAARRTVTSIVESSVSNEFVLVSEEGGGLQSSVTLVPEDDSSNSWPSDAVTKQWIFGTTSNWNGDPIRPKPVRGGSIFEYAPRKFALVCMDGIRFLEEYDGENIPTGGYQDPITGLIAPELTQTPPADNYFDHPAEGRFPKNSIGGQFDTILGTAPDGSDKWDYSFDNVYGYINATGENAKFGKIVAADMWQNYLFVLDARAQALRRVDLQTRAVVTLAGDITNQGTVSSTWYTTPETVDGIGTDARFYLHRVSESSNQYSDIAVHPSGTWALISQDPASSSVSVNAILRKVYLTADGGFQENEVVKFVDYKSSPPDASAEGGVALADFGWRGNRYRNLEFSPDGSTLYFTNAYNQLYRIQGIDTDEPRVFVTGSGGIQSPQEDQGPGNTTFGELRQLQLRSPSGRVFAVDTGARNEVRILGTAESS